MTEYLSPNHLGLSPSPPTGATFDRLACRQRSQDSGLDDGLAQHKGPGIAPSLWLRSSVGWGARGWVSRQPTRNFTQ